MMAVQGEGFYTFLTNT